MERRDFLKALGVGTLALSMGPVSRKAYAAIGPKADIGVCKRVKIKCISETGWWSNALLLSDLKQAGKGNLKKGLGVSQWEIDWNRNNGAGSCSLIEVETLDGKTHRILIDTGWDPFWMDKRFKEEKVDEMLMDGAIDFLFITHEHLDHFWGLETTLTYNPKIKIVIPSTFYPEAYHFLRGAQFLYPKARNLVPHRGELVETKPGKVYNWFPGCGSATFDFPIIVRIRGEQSLFFNVKGKGMVLVTGCGHQSLLALADFVQKKVVGGEKMYGVYGGLHIAPFGPIIPKRAPIITGMAKYNFKKIACNHCTGLAAVKKMIDLGYPVVRGTARYGSVSDLYVGNGDEVVF